MGDLSFPDVGVSSYSGVLGVDTGGAQEIGPGSRDVSTSGFLLPGGFSVDMNFANGNFYGIGLSGLTVTRAGTGATSLLSIAAAGASYFTYGANVARIVPGSGLLVEESRTNVLLNSTAPVTQTTASLGTGTYTLWVNGTGSATSSAGTATITGAGAATNGTPNVFVVTVAGTVTITVAGSLNAFQCELNPGTISAPTSLIVTGGATVTRSVDNATIAVTIPSPITNGLTFFAEARFLAPATYAANQFFGEISNGTTGQRFGILRLANTALDSTTDTGGGAPATNVAISTNTIAKAALSSIPGGNANEALNGSSATPSASASGPTGLNIVTVGQRADATGASNVNGFIIRLAIALTALPATSLAAITSLNAYN